MSTTGIAAGLWPMFKRILLRLGGWVLGELFIHGARALSAYIEIRGHYFARQSPRARSKRRRSWLLSRSRRWLFAAQWLRDRADDIADRVVESWLALYDERKVPERSPLEKMRGKEG